MNPISENYRRLLDRIGEASLRSGRTPEAVRLVGVTKRVAAERVREAVDCGLTDIGERGKTKSTSHYRRKLFY